MASAYLSRSISSTGNQKKMTFSAWIKRAGVGATGCLFATGVGAERSMILIESGGNFQFSRYNSSYIWHLNTTRKLRDPNAWYHIVCALDTTQSTASDRAKIWINGVQETSFGTETYPSLNYNDGFNTSGKTQYVGQDSDGNQDFDGQLAHVHYVDGTAYTPTTFGETDSTTGIWKPKTAPSVTYGTNGFFLKFDNSANMGLDSAGSNNLTTTGTIIQNKDTPSNVFACLNPSARRITTNAPTYKNANNTLQGQTGNGQNNNVIATLGDLAKGKYYFECKVQTVGDDLCQVLMNLEF